MPARPGSCRARLARGGGPPYEAARGPAHCDPAHWDSLGQAYGKRHGSLPPGARYLYVPPTKGNSTWETRMRPPVVLIAATLTLATGLAHADERRLKPKEVVSKFMNEFYIQKHVRTAFETWVAPGYVQHNPLAAAGLGGGPTWARWPTVGRRWRATPTGSAAATCCT